SDPPGRHPPSRILERHRRRPRLRRRVRRGAAMIRASDDLAHEYGAALKRFLAGGGEEGLKRAYDLGRRAVNVDAGLVAVVLIHQRALDPLVRKAAASARPRTVSRAMDFLAECL